MQGKCNRRHGLGGRHVPDKDWDGDVDSIPTRIAELLHIGLEVWLKALPVIKVSRWPLSWCIDAFLCATW